MEDVLWDTIKTIGCPSISRMDFRSADKIIVLDDGKVAGMGTHQELLNNCEVYQEIYYSQFEKEEGKMAAAEEGVSVHE